MQWNIVADTSCDLNALPIPDENVAFHSVPFVIRAGEHEFVDETGLDIVNMVATLEATKEPGHTACPSPETWFEKFSKPGKVIAIIGIIVAAAAAAHEPHAFAGADRKRNALDRRPRRPAVADAQPLGRQQRFRPFVHAPDSSTRPGARATERISFAVHRLVVYDDAP